MERYELTTDGGIRFVRTSAAYIDVYFGAQCSDCINVWNYETGTSTVNTPEEFQAAVNDYLCEQDENLDAHWNAAFYATVTEGMS